MSYPEIQSLVLDASFDDLLPLALKVMPNSWSESEAFIYYVFAAGRFVSATEMSLLSLRAAGAAHSETVYEPQQRQAASQVSGQSIYSDTQDYHKPVKNQPQ